MQDPMRSYLMAVQDALRNADVVALEAIVEKLYEAYHEGRTVFTMGNGASASLAAHMACDLGKGTAGDLALGPSRAAARRLRIISLVDNIALLTAIGNDISYQDTFVEQLKNLMNPSDIVIGISGSGASPNIVRAMEYAHREGACTIGITGSQPGAAQIGRYSHICLQAPLTMMEQIEDAHVVFHHIITVSLRERLAGERAATIMMPVAPVDVPAIAAWPDAQDDA
jgi:D-sedoheptulose 7-phosphate isomerase